MGLRSTLKFEAKEKIRRFVAYTILNLVSLNESQNLLASGAGVSTCGLKWPCGVCGLGRYAIFKFLAIFCSLNIMRNLIATSNGKNVCHDLLMCCYTSY